MHRCRALYQLGLTFGLRYRGEVDRTRSAGMPPQRIPQSQTEGMGRMLMPGETTRRQARASSGRGAVLPVGRETGEEATGERERRRHLPLSFCVRCKIISYS
eukprot:scaffold264042_cov31-Tisochrysis_lutea.AAC.1